MDKTIVRLLKQWGSHNSGEIAGFAPHVASKLIGQGFAELHPRSAPEPAPIADLSEQTDAGDPPKPAPAAAAKKTSTTKKSS